jgi:hypothetical protein
VKSLRTQDIVILALKMEAKNNPNKKLVIGQKVMTYRELASKIAVKFEQKKSLPKMEDKFIEAFVNNSVIMFNTNPTFKTKMLELASPANT